LSPTTTQVKRLGHGINIDIAAWDLRKFKAMKKILKAKFRKDPLRQMLLDTGDAMLIEGNYWHDNIWGACRCNKCTSKYNSESIEDSTNKCTRNNLGRILMEVREKLQNP